MKQQPPPAQPAPSASSPIAPDHPHSLVSLQRWLRRLFAPVLLFVGFLLSPFSWWNDLLVNVPLALAFARLVSRLYLPLLGPAFCVGYLATNVLGLVLMHVAARIALTDPWLTTCLRRLRIETLPKPRPLREASFALLYTAVVMAMMHRGFLKPLGIHFHSNGDYRAASLSSTLPPR